MAYVKTNWASSDVVTVANLNKIEQGICDVEAKAGSLVVDCPQYRSTATLGEIVDAFLSGKIIWLKIGWSTDPFVTEQIALVTGINNLDALNDTSVGKYVETYSGTFVAYSPNESIHMDGGE